MQKLNNFIFIIFLLIVSSCSSEKLSTNEKYINVFKDKNEFAYVNEAERKNSKLDIVKEIKNLYNSKSYNLSNSLVKFPLQKIWQINTNQNIDDENPYLSEPILISAHLYLINNNGTLFKINAESGDVIWKKTVFEGLDNTIIGAPSISGSMSKDGAISIFVHNGDSHLLCLDGKIGKIIWQKKHTLPFRGGITVHQSSLFLSDYEGNFISFNINNGSIKWDIFLGSDYNSIYTNARPIIAKNKVIVPGTGGTFFVVLIDTGEVLWSENVSSNKQLPKIFHTGDIVANPIYHKDVIYIVSQSGFLAAFDVNKAQELWTLPIGGNQTPTLSGETIFINGNMGLLKAIDIISGKVRWTRKYPSYINKDSYFAEEKVAIYKGPTLIDSKILFADQNGFISILDANNGKKIDGLSVDKLAIAPIPVDKKVFLLTESGTLLAYK